MSTHTKASLIFLLACFGLESLLLAGESRWFQSQPNSPSTATASRTKDPNALGQEFPTFASIADLSKNPRKFNGRVVQVRAWLAFGWEGDNFLFDSSETAPRGMPAHPSASVWFYCRADHERQVRDVINFGGPPVLGTFMGYFHFVPDQKSRMKAAFDPGALQLEVIGVSDVSPTAKPDVFGLAIPHN